MTPRLLLASLLVFLVAAQPKDAAWKEFTSKDGGFTVTMPGTPIEQKDSLRAPSGPLDLTLYVVEHKAPPTAYIAMFCEFPEAVLKTGTAQRRLDYARDRAVATTNGKLVYHKKLMLGAHPGRELRFEVEGKAVVRQRLYAVKNKLYQLLLAGPKEAVLGKDADRFLDSFRLTP